MCVFILLDVRGCELARVPDGCDLKPDPAKRASNVVSNVVSNLDSVRSSDPVSNLNSGLMPVGGLAAPRSSGHGVCRRTPLRYPWASAPPPVGGGLGLAGPDTDIDVMLLELTPLLSFTGYLLPWDQLARLQQMFGDLSFDAPFTTASTCTDPPRRERGDGAPKRPSESGLHALSGSWLGGELPVQGGAPGRRSGGGAGSAGGRLRFGRSGTSA